MSDGFFDDHGKINFKKLFGCVLHIKTKHKKLVVACRNINNILFIIQLACMLAVSFQLLTWCSDSADHLIFFSQLMLIKMHTNCSFAFKMSLGQ